jgi:bifunctional enzyme CysN/CysC
MARTGPAVTWAVWLVGPPASGKSALAGALSRLLAADGTRPVLLESDRVRPILAPGAGYEPEERDRFYRSLGDLAALLVSQGFPVILDATAPRARHRDHARRLIPAFREVLVETPLAVREGRDTKGLYRLARGGQAPHLPGLTEPFERPQRPDLVVEGTGPPEASAARLIEAFGLGEKR